MATTATPVSVELVPLCRCAAVLEPPIVVDNTPSGTRYIVGVRSLRLDGERLRATAKGGSGADYLTVSQGGVGTLDVRVPLETDDGALIFMHYNGRVDLVPGPGNAAIYVAPLFDTGDERYAWLSKIQAVGKGAVTPDMVNIDYEFFEVR